MSNFDIEIKIDLLDDMVFEVNSSDTIEARVFQWPDAYDPLAERVKTLEDNPAIVEIATDSTIQGSATESDPLSIQSTVNYLLSIIRQLAPELIITGVEVGWDGAITVTTTTTGGIEPITTEWELVGFILTVTVTDALSTQVTDVIDLSEQYPITINSIGVIWNDGFVFSVDATGGFGEYIVTYEQTGAILNVTLTDQIGITAETQLDLDDISPIVIASIGFEIVSEAEAEITCIASGGFGALAYSLYFGDGFVESNSTGIFTVDEIGSYYVRVTDEGGASGVNSDVIQVEINPYILSYTARSSSELIDESNTYPARIMPSVGYASAGYLSIQPAGINLVCDTNNSIWWRGTFANVTSATNFMMARQDSNVRRIGFISANRLHIQPNLTASIAYIDMPWWLKNNVLYDICILSKGAGVWELYVNGRFMGSATSTDSSITIYTLIKGLVGEVHFFGVYNRLVTVQEMAARNIITTDLKAGYFITGRGKYAYDISGNGLNLPWVGATNPWIYSDKANAYYMDNGWKLYQKDGEPDEIVPINASVTAIVAAGYTLTRTYTGSATNINMYPSAVRFRSVVQASDVRTPLAGVATIGTAGAGTISLLIHDRRQRIRKTGYLEYISLYYVDNTPANTDSVKLQIWRENPTNTFTKIHIYDITAFTKGQGTGTKTIVLPSLDVQEGDYLGFEIINNAANLVLRGVTDGINYYKCVAISTYTYAGATGATFAWKSLGSTLEASVIVNANMINPQLVAIGDSIVSGIGSDTYSFVDTIQSNLLNPQNCITGQLATLNANLSYQNLGVSGDEIVTINGDIQSPFRFYQQAMLSRPKIVVINGGINDIAGGQTNSVIVANALNMVDLSNDIGAFSIYLHITPWNTGTTQQMQNRDAIKVLINQGMATRQGVAIDLDTILGKFRVGGDVGNLWDYKDGLNFDAVHPNTAGYAAIAAEIYRVLGELNYNIYKENSNYKLLCRNNSTYQENDSRSGDGYSLVQPYMYTIDELVNSVLINTYLTDGYKDSIVVEKVENGGVTTAITSIKVKKFT